MNGTDETDTDGSKRELRVYYNEDGNNVNGIISEETAMDVWELVGGRNWDALNGKSDNNAITVWSALYNHLEMTQNDIPDIPGINIKEGIENSGSKELFLSLLVDLYKLIDQKSVKIEKCLADGLLREYTIEVHALKSTARMIGALELSDKFYNLEKLGNAEGQIALEKQTPDVLLSYRSFKPLLEPFAKSMEQEKNEVSTEEMIETLNRLRNAIDCFDLFCTKCWILLRSGSYFLHKKGVAH